MNVMDTAEAVGEPVSPSSLMTLYTWLYLGLLSDMYTTAAKKNAGARNA